MFTIIFVSVTHRSPINFLLFLVSLGPMCPRQFFFHSLSSSHTKCLSYPICSSVSIYIPRPSFSAKFSSFDIVHLLLQMKYCVSLPFFPPNIAGRLGEWYLYLVFFICICSVFGECMLIFWSWVRIPVTARSKFFGFRGLGSAHWITLGKPYLSIDKKDVVA